MDKNTEILDVFGEKIINEIFDPAIGNLKSLRKKENPPLIFKDYVELFKKLDENDFDVLVKYLKYSFGSGVFNFLKVFEENPQFKIVYEKDGEQVNLVKISEDLKAEPIIQNGWIERFSKEK